MKKFIIAVDFDGTIVDHVFPDLGEPVPHAFYYMKRWQQAGAKLILWTMRTKHFDREVLQEAIDLCWDNGILFWGVNESPIQHNWTSSPKVYANVYIDDAAYGCPLRGNPRPGGKPYADWDRIGPAVILLIESRLELHHN